MARLPIYEQQVGSKSNSVTPQEMGAGVGQAMGQVGSVLTDIGVTMQRREDTFEAIRSNNELDVFAQQSSEALSAEDMANPATVKKYQEGLRAKADEILGSYSGSSAMRASLRNQIENQIGQYTKGALAAQVKAQYKMVGDLIDKTSNDLAIDGSFAPQEMENIFSEFETRLTTLKDAIPADMYDSFRISGRQKIATNSIYSLLNQENYLSAKALMINPNVGGILDPNTARKFTIDIAVAEGKQAAETARQDANVRKYTAFLGDLTPDQIMRIRTLPPEKDMTVSDKIIEYGIVTNNPNVPQTVIDRFFKIEAETGGGIGGNSLKAQAIRFVSENAVSYANGTMDPQQARNFEAMYTEAYAPVEKQDPLTGMWTKIQPTVPSYAQEAIRRGSGVYGGLSAASPSQGARTPMSAQAGGGTMVMKDGQPLNRPPRPGENIELMVDGQMVGSTTVGADGVWSIKDAQGSTPSPPQATQAEQTGIYGQAKYLAGPKPAIARQLTGTPVFGGDMGIDPKYTQLKTQVGIIRDRITNSMRPDSRIANQYREELRDLVDIQGRVWDNEKALQSRLIAIDKELRKTLKNLDKITTGQEKVSLQEQKDALDISNAIRASLTDLDVPQSNPKTRKEVEALPPGTVFRYGDDPTPRTKK
jgi:hypothetical protein